MFAPPSSPTPTPTPTSGGSLPPWAHRPAAPPAQPVQPAPVDIPGPWSRPASPKPVTPSAAPTPAPAQPVMPAGEAMKDWGPLKPIRTVPKPDEKKVAYILAQTEQVVNPDEERSRKKWIILGSLIGVLVIAGGTFAFIFFGRGTQTPKLDTNTLTIVDTLTKNKNVNTNGVFPNVNTANSNTNTANVNSSTNVNGNQNTAPPPKSVNAFGSSVDQDVDGIANSFELYLGTDPNKADTDGDEHMDGVELANGYSPLGTGRVTLAMYQKYCTNFMVDLKLWTAAHRTAFCKETGVIAGNAITALIAGDTLKEFTLLKAGNTAMLAWCKTTFTKASEEASGSCADAQDVAFSEFFISQSLIKP